MSQNGVAGNAEKVACITQPVSDTLASLVPVAADRGPIATRRGDTGRSWTRSRNTSRGTNGWRAIFRPLAAGRTLLLSETINLGLLQFLDLDIPEVHFASFGLEADHPL